MGKQHGYDFEKEIGKSLELLRTDKPKYRTLWYYKLVDTYAYDWIKDYIPDAPKELDVHRTAQFKYQMILPKVPSDYLVIYGKTTFIECKSSQDRVGLPIANIKEHQLQMSEDIEKAGAPYYFYICKREPRNNILYIVKAKDVRYLVNMLKTGKIRKSKIAWHLLERYAEHTLPKSRGCVYDLSEVF